MLIKKEVKRRETAQKQKKDGVSSLDEETREIRKNRELVSLMLNFN